MSFSLIYIALRVFLTTTAVVLMYGFYRAGIGDARTVWGSVLMAISVWVMPA